MIASPSLLAELADVLSRDRFRKWFDPQDADNVVAAVREWAILYEPQIQVTACRDPDDNYLLALAETSAADYLVTRDKDLLVLGKWKNTIITYPAQFLATVAAAP